MSSTQAAGSLKPAFLVSFATLHPCLADSFASSRILMRFSKAISSHSGSSIISRSLSPIALMQNCLNRSKPSSVSMARHPCPPGVGSPDMAGMLRAPLQLLPAPDRRRFLRMLPYLLLDRVLQGRVARHRPERIDASACGFELYGRIALREGEYVAAGEEGLLYHGPRIEQADDGLPRLGPDPACPALEALPRPRRLLPVAFRHVLGEGRILTLPAPEPGMGRNHGAAAHDQSLVAVKLMSTCIPISLCGTEQWP